MLTSALLIDLTVTYFLAISAGGESESRFRVPVMPYLAIAAAAGVETSGPGLRDRSRNSRA